MSKKRIVVSIFFIAVIALLNVLILTCNFPVEDEYVTVNITVNSDKENAFALYYIEDGKAK